MSSHFQRIAARLICTICLEDTNKLSLLLNHYTYNLHITQMRVYIYKRYDICIMHKERHDVNELL